VCVALCMWLAGSMRGAVPGGPATVLEKNPAVKSATDSGIRAAVCSLGI